MLTAAGSLENFPLCKFSFKLKSSVDLLPVFETMTIEKCVSYICKFDEDLGLALWNSPLQRY